MGTSVEWKIADWYEVMFGEVEGKTKRGRPKREWLDDVLKEWWNEVMYILKCKAQDRVA